MKILSARSLQYSILQKIFQPVLLEYLYPAPRKTLFFKQGCKDAKYYHKESPMVQNGVWGLQSFQSGLD